MNIKSAVDVSQAKNAAIFPVKKVSDSSTDFSQIFNMSSAKADNDTYNQADLKVEKVEDEAVDFDENGKIEEKPDNFAAEENAAVSDNRKISDSKESENASKDDLVEDDMDLSGKDIKHKLSDTSVEDFMELLQGLLTEIQEVLQEQFDVTASELTKGLEEFGLKLSDLLNPETMQEFISYISGNEDLMAFVTDENLMAGFKEMMTKITDLIESYAGEMDVMPKELEDILSLMDFNISADEETGIDISKMLEQAEMNLKKAEILPENRPEIETTLSAMKNPEESMKGGETAAEPELQNQAENNLEQPVQNKTDVNPDSKQEHLSQDKKDGKNDNFDNSLTNLQNAATENVNVSEKLEKTFYRTDSQALDIINQIADAVKVKGLENGTVMELQLSPEHLGKINMQIAAREGIITAHIVAQTEAAKDAITANVEILKENLNNQGLKVEAVEVSVASHNLEQNLEQNQKNDEPEKTKKNRHFRFDVQDENGEFMSVEAENTKQRVILETNTSVNYFV